MLNHVFLITDVKFQVFMAVTGQIMAACRLAVGETRDLARELRRIVTVPISKCRDEDSIFIRKVQIDLHLNTTAETVY